MELEPSPEPTPFQPQRDRRPRLPEPLPVRLVAVADVGLPANAGMEPHLDGFYVGLFGFERDDVEPPPPKLMTRPLLGEEVPKPVRVRRPGRDADAGTFRLPPGALRGPVYRAENFRLRFHLVEGLIVRESVRPVGIELPSLADVEQKLIDAEIEYARQRGVTPGQESLFLVDPAGNWVELVEVRAI